MEDIILRIQDISKEYRLGQIGGTTLRDELQRFHAKLHKKDDPTLKIGESSEHHGERFLALNNVSFDVKKGERVGIIGHNGAGKSTLLKLISRITAPTTGSISLNGRVASMLEVGTGFHPELTGRENVYMNGAILGMTKREIDAKMEDIIEFSEVRQFIDTPVKRYSSGMYVKLAFSVAAHLDSEIMIMDEVLAVGDMAFQQKCLKKMRDVSNEDGRTILYVSHNMNTIRQLCDKVIVLDHGEVIFNGAVEDGINRYLGIVDDCYPNKYDLDVVSRPRRTHGSKIRLLDFEFIDKVSAVFDRRTESMRFRVNIRSNSRIDALRMVISISTNSGTRIGFMQSNTPFADAEPNKKYMFNFYTDISELIEGKYHFIIDVFSIDDNNNHLSYDHPNIEIPFRVIDSKPAGLKPNIERWGATEISPLRCVESCMITE